MSGEGANSGAVQLGRPACGPLDVLEVLLPRLFTFGKSSIRADRRYIELVRCELLP